MKPEDYLEGFPGDKSSSAHLREADMVPPAPAGFDESYVSQFANQGFAQTPKPSSSHHHNQNSNDFDSLNASEFSDDVQAGLHTEESPSLSDMARSSHKHKRRLFGLVLLVLFVAIIIGAIIGARYWIEQQKGRRSNLPVAITPTGDTQSESFGKKGPILGADAEKPSKDSPGGATPGTPGSVGSPSGKPGPLSGPALSQQGGPGQPLVPAAPTGFDANGRPIATQPIIPPNRFDSPLGAQDGRGYVNAAQGQGGGAGAPNSTSNPTTTPGGSTGLFNPLQYLQQMGQAGAANSTPSSATGSFSGSLTSTKTPAAKASLIGNRSLMLTKGALIPCVLDTAVVSSVSSMVRCHTPKDVFSEDGKVVLFEAGSQIKGEFSSSALKTGSKRLYILWSRIDTPLGIKIDLESPGADQLGRGGLDGDLDKHWGERIGSAFLLSFVQDAIAYAATRGGNQMAPGVYQNTTNTGNQMATEVLKDTIAIPPTLSINQGELVNIFVARDLDFSDVYQLKAK